ncbi:MAG: hypothetical protein V4555_06805 [Acidobacteriota bacterium]
MQPDQEPQLSRIGGSKPFSQLAELYVAGLFTQEGWRVYFPHSDDGFDFIAAKPSPNGVILRPVQVKGKYPKDTKSDKPVYGYVGELSQVHPEMVLAIPYFAVGDLPVLCHVAFMPFWKIGSSSRGVKCQPAKFSKGKAAPRRDHLKFFDREGLQWLSNRNWSKEVLAGDPPE